jgi:coenzyme F420-reducing hydrogenase alpha subunit
MPAGLGFPTNFDKSISRAGVAVDRVPRGTTVHDEDTDDPFHERNMRVSTYKNVRAYVAKLRSQT